MTQAISPPQVPDLDTAFATVNDKIYAPVFFDKLARDYGHANLSQEEKFAALQLAAQLRIQANEQQAKSASSNSELLSAYQEYQQTPAAQANGNAVLIKRAAYNAALNDPDLARSVLALHYHQQNGQQQAPAA